VETVLAHPSPATEDHFRVEATAFLYEIIRAAD
jgi:hypothetical protein